MQSTSTQPNSTEVIPRLKTAQYGEVLTTEEVLERLKEENLKKKYKKKIETGNREAYEKIVNRYF